MNGAIESFARDGVALIPSVFNREETDHMRGAALAALAEPNPSYPHKRLQKRGDFPSLLYWPAVVSSNLRAVLFDERLARIVRAFLGDEVKQINNQVYFRLPGDGDSFCWHQDICFRPEAHFRGIEDAYLQTIVAIDEVGPENSAVEFMPGSHRLGRVKHFATPGGRLRHFERDGDVGVKYAAKSGDVLIWSVLTVHGSEENRGDRMRMTYMNGFARADAVREGVGYPDYLRGGRSVGEIDMSRFPHA